MSYEHQFSLLRYFSGLASNFFTHGAQQNLISCPLYTLVTGSPIDPSLLSVTMHLSEV